MFRSSWVSIRAQQLWETWPRCLLMALKLSAPTSKLATDTTTSARSRRDSLAESCGTLLCRGHRLCC